MNVRRDDFVIDRMGYKFIYELEYCLQLLERPFQTFFCYFKNIDHLEYEIQPFTFLSCTTPNCWKHTDDFNVDSYTIHKTNCFKYKFNK